MADLHDREGNPFSSDAAHDRRRPGRIEIINVHLLSLLRRRRASDAAGAQTDAALDDGSAQFGESNQLAAAVGVFFSVIIGVAMWSCIAAAVWLILRAGTH